MHTRDRATAILAVVCAACAGPSAAAGRSCLPVVTSERHTSAREAEARRLALESWTARAKTHGEAFAAWRLATPRSISCRRLDGGLYACQASGMPCRIQQVPTPAQPLPAPEPRGKVIDL